MEAEVTTNGLSPESGTSFEQTDLNLIVMKVGKSICL